MLFLTSLRHFIFKSTVSLLIVVFFGNSVFSFSNRTIEELPDNSSSLQTSASCTDVQFNQAPEYAAGTNPKGVAVADFDSDGKQDIAVSSSNGLLYGFSVLRNLGSNQFAPKIDFTLPINSIVEAIFIQDLDGDGKTDVVLSAWSGKRISVFKNISSGAGIINFASGVEYVVGDEQPFNVAFGDLDGDGSPEIITANAGSENPTISIFRNTSKETGNLSFASRIDLKLPYSPYVLAVGDIDGDGKLDLAVGASKLFILRNISTSVGSINFDTSFSFDTPIPSISLGDFDSDNKLDVAMLDGDNRVKIIRNTSSGSGSVSFAAPQYFAVGLAPRVVITGDFDKDGKLDVATANTNGNSVSILRNTSSGSGNIAFAPRLWDFGAGIVPYNITIGELNSDGKPDIITANREGNNVSVLINNGTAGIVDFVARKDYLTLNNAGVTSIVSEDFDGDGNKDLAASLDQSRNGFKFYIYPNNGSGHFPTSLDLSPIAGNVIAVKPFFISSGDFDNDGKADIAMVGSWAEQGIVSEGLRVFRNISSGAGNFSFALSDFTLKFQNPIRIFVVDLNADGKPDIIATYKQLPYDETALILRNTSTSNGSISFSQSTIFTLQLSSEISFADLNSDNKIDLAYSPSYFISKTLRVRLNTSSDPAQISFDQSDISLSEVDLSGSVTGDLNGDGKPDLIGQKNGDIYYLRNIGAQGELSFGSTQLFTNLFIAPSKTIDLDKDGKTDVIGRANSFISFFKNSSSGESVYLNNGRYFAIGGSTNQGKHTSLIFADLDNNGKLDVVNGFNSPFIGTISVLLNRQCTSTRKTAFDFDGDGRADVSVFRSGTWYINRSSQGFSGINWGDATDVLAPTDFDGDGKTDVAVFRDGNWYWINSSNNQFNSAQFGQAGDIPIPEDFDGDGRADIAVFRPSLGTWYRLNSSNNQFVGVRFGTNGDKPLVGDFDGDGKADLAVARSTNGNLFWYWTASSTNQFNALQFGLADDLATPADYDGDGKTDVSVFRLSMGTWYRLNSAQNNQFFAVQFGLAGDVPTPADYDGDGKVDVAVFRSGAWYRLNSANNAFYGEQFGIAADKAVPSAFIR